MLSVSEMNKRLPKESRFKVVEIVEIYVSPRCGKVSQKIKVRCRCGVEKTINYSNIRNTLSCGCYAKEVLSKRCTKYYPVVRSLYRAWRNMIKRCYEKKNKSYSYYGGRGVIVCDEWKNNYQKFLDWALANGYKEGLQLDKDIVGDGLLYSPETCCWVTKKINQQNKRNTIVMEYNGQKMPLSEICEINNMPYDKVWWRIFQLKKTLSEALKKESLNPGKGAGKKMSPEAIEKMKKSHIELWKRRKEIKAAQ